ncbi:MAG: hypothetical protein JOZ17_24600 [Acetobacteraceae bacterium]|nr:hypothetical protein [Acetobacteraceae bacterium]
MDERVSGRLQGNNRENSFTSPRKGEIGSEMPGVHKGLDQNSLAIQNRELQWR